MKKIRECCLDKNREILQIIFLLFCLCFPSAFNLSEIIRSLFGGQSPDFDTAVYYYLMKAGNISIGILLFVYALFKFVRSLNKETVLNKGNRYHNHSYAWYWFCSSVLGYESCNLILVPIHMQMKLVIRDTFKHYPIDEDMFPKGNDEVFVECSNGKKEADEINLVLEDTHFISDKQINKAYSTIQTIRISRKIENEGTRSYSNFFVDQVVSTLRGLPEETIVNIFATINPKHCFEISKKGIALANRGNLKHVNVFQQTDFSEKRSFEVKHKIY